MANPEIKIETFGINPLKGTYATLNKIRLENISGRQRVARRLVKGEGYFTIGPGLRSDGSLRVGYQRKEPKIPGKPTITQRASIFVDMYNNVEIHRISRSFRTSMGLQDDPDFIPPSLDVIIEEIAAAFEAQIPDPKLAINSI